VWYEDDYEPPGSRHRTRFVECGHVHRTKVRVMEIVVILRYPKEIKLPGQVETLERSLD